MTGEIRRIRTTNSVKENDENLVTENCNCSGYTMATVAACILLCIGIVVYALIGA